MRIEYRKINDTTVYAEENVISIYVGQEKDGYFLNYNVEYDNQDRIVCPVELDSIKINA